MLINIFVRQWHVFIVTWILQVNLKNLSYSYPIMVCEQKLWNCKWDVYNPRFVTCRFTNVISWQIIVQENSDNRMKFLFAASYSFIITVLLEILKWNSVNWIARVILISSVELTVQRQTVTFENHFSARKTVANLWLPCLWKGWFAIIYSQLNPL